MYNLTSTAETFSCHQLYSHEQYRLGVPSSFPGSTLTPTAGSKNKSSQYIQHTHDIIKNPPFPFTLILLCFPWDHVVAKARLMNSGQLVGLKCIDRTATSQPAFLPGCVALIVQSVRSICYWAALLAWQQRAGSITSIAWWLRREQRGHAC